MVNYWFSLSSMALILGLQVPARAAVYEVGDDGSVARIDQFQPAPAKSARVAMSRTDVGRRAQSYQPLVARAARQYEVSPALVDAIAHTESRYNQRAVSPANAVGIMQLMPGTARQMGVDRNDPEANIRGGTAYLRFLLNRFDGNVLCTIAAYNAGPGAVTKARCIPPYRETAAYVTAVLDRLARAAD